MRKLITLFVSTGLLITISCRREPELHLYEAADATFDVPVIDLSLDVYWDYEMVFGIDFDWQAEWWYGWDEQDRLLFGELGYSQPSVFNLRRYHTGNVPFAPHTSVLSDMVYGTTFRGRFDWGFWDLLVWNDIVTLDGVQSLVFDETSTLEQVTARTNQSMHAAPYHRADGYSNAFYEPEPLFAAYEQGTEVNQNLEGFVYDPERRVYVKRLSMMMLPITYIYLTQVILHHNNGRVVAIDGSSNLSGMARSTTLNTGRAGHDAIAVYYNTRLKNNCLKDGERVDIIGGRLMTFGICDLAANTVAKPDDITDEHSHYMDVTMQFNNGKDSTFVFDVTSQVRRHYKGGVLTVELDLDTVPLPSRSGGSGFDAVVLEPDSVTHVIEM